jgi:exonuclease III
MKTGRRSNTYLRQSRLQTYINQMRYKRKVHTNKSGNTPKGNNYQPICTHHQCTQFHQTYSERHKCIDSNTVVVGDFNTPLSPVDRSSKQKSNKEILDLNHTIDQMNPADVYRIFHQTFAQYTFFSAAHGTFSKYKKIEIIQCI